MQISDSNILELESESLPKSTLMLKLENENESQIVTSDEEIELTIKALSSKTRRQILSMIQHQPSDVSNIASALNMTEANISAQIKMLERAGLITCDYSSGNHGVRKISVLKFKRLIFKF
ncbi:MAG: ArsR/SmtB family transcription factor [Promethearchaeota archaeon]